MAIVDKVTGIITFRMVFAPNKTTIPPFKKVLASPANNIARTTWFMPNTPVFCMLITDNAMASMAAKPAKKLDIKRPLFPK